MNILYFISEYSLINSSMRGNSLISFEPELTRIFIFLNSIPDYLFESPKVAQKQFIRVEDTIWIIVGDVTF